MEHQIILLPKKGYWDWVRASRTYVSHYGPNLTQDPGTAARYMAPAQVITFPLVPGAFPEVGDLEDWFQQQYPGIRIDPVSVTSPDELEAELDLRVEQEDRYGQKRRPFYLLWPTDYSVVTQKFGVNEHIYSRFGMPGHEGIDIRALNNTNIYCSADGEVYLVHTNPKSHAYGIHVRVRHKDGYKTVYAHLAQPLVKENQVVSAGQVIGKADSTGASTGSHLHLTLKRDGATERGETRFPKDVIDPTPFMVWPERSRKSIPRTQWLREHCLTGVHVRVGTDFTEDDFSLITTLRPDAVYLKIREKDASIDRLRAINPEVFLLANINSDLSTEPVTPEQFIGLIKNDVGRFYSKGIRYFEIGSNPNIQAEGFRRSWKNGLEYSDWFLKVLKKLRSSYKDAQFGFPGLSPGDDIPGWRSDHITFLRDAESAILESDWIGVHTHWLDHLGMRSPLGGRLFDRYRSSFPDKLIFITEFNNPSSRISSKQRAEQYHEYLRMLQSDDGIGAAFIFALDADDEELNFVLNKKVEDRDEWIEILKADQD